MKKPKRREWTRKRGVKLTDSYKLEQVWPLVLHNCFPLFSHSHPVLFQHTVRDILANLLFLQTAKPPSVVLFFLTISVFPSTASAPTTKSIYSKLDPRCLISASVYLFALCCLICWGEVQLSQSTKLWLSVYFKPLFSYPGKVGLSSLKALDTFIHICPRPKL